MPLSEVLKHIPKPESSQSPVADIGTLQSQDDGPLKSVIRITARVPLDHHVPEQSETVPSSTVPSSAERLPVDQHVPVQGQSLPSTAAQVSVNHQIPEQSEVPPSSQLQPSQLPTSQMIQLTPQLPSATLPQQPDISIDPPSNIVPAALPIFPGSLPFQQNKSPTPVQTSETTNLSLPIVPRPDITPARTMFGPIINVITAPGKKIRVKSTSKDQDRNANRDVKFQSEINNALNNSK
jgi:hypothetical protein